MRFYNFCKVRFVYRNVFMLLLSITCGMLPFIFPEWSNLLASEGYYCGYYDTVEKGDVNDDNIVDLKDAVLALKIISGIHDLPFICIYSDVNDDDKIGLEEVIYILQEISEE